MALNYIISRIKDPLFTGILLLLCLAGYAQPEGPVTFTFPQNPQYKVIALEYFFDNDPGVGQATPIPVSESVDVELNNITITGINTLNAGIHKLYVRAKNTSGAWSITNSVLFFIPPPVSQIQGRAIENITGSEYFFDEDPGPGHGTRISITPGTDINENNVVISGLEELGAGIHQLYIRIQNENGNWSLANRTIFFISSKEVLINETPLPSNITGIEYYIDTDPGEGNAHKVPVTGNPDITDLAFEVGMNEVDTGDHKLFVRVRNENNNWSLMSVVSFNVHLPVPSDVQVISIELEDGECALTDETEVEVKLRNGGDNPVSGFNINLDIDDVVLATETVSDEILPGDTLSYVFAKKANLSDLKTYQIRVFTTLINDENPGNDTLVKSITHNEPVSKGVSTDAILCNGGQASLSAFGGVSYQWSNGITTALNEVTPAETTTYYVTITDPYNCIKYDSVTVTVLPALTPPVISTKGNNEACFGETITLVTDIEEIVKWYQIEGTDRVFLSESDTLVATTAGKYIAVLTAATGCTVNSDEFTVNILPKPFITADPAEPICKGDPVTLKVENAAIYAWSTGATTESIKVAPEDTTTYFVSGTNAAGCTYSDSITVSVLPATPPDPPVNMLPADGSVNLQLPLKLSWVPAHPELDYTYDIYIWKAGEEQPVAPFVSSIRDVNYTIPVNSGLEYNTTYKWMVVPRNGSCVEVHTGPVQEFSLVPLPDLEVLNVQAPSSIFSGQDMTVTWTVRNNGPGHTLTNQKWTDAVYISKDPVLDLFDINNQLSFPTIPKLAATVTNVSGLNNGDSYSGTATFKLPVDYAGDLYVYVITNYQPPYNNPVVETTLENDTAGTATPTVVSLSPQPDFRVDTVFVPANLFSGNTINLTYKVTNHGDAAATGNWSDKIYISSDPLFNPATATLLKKAKSIGVYYPADDAIVGRNGSLLPDDSYTESVEVVIPNFIFGNYFIYVETNSGNTIYEGPGHNNNIGKSPVMEVFLTATPKIVPGNVQIAEEGSTAQTMEVNWTNLNQGANDNLEKNKGHYMVVTSEDCTQGKVYRDSLGFGGSYWVDKVYISQDPNGFNPANARLVGELAHGSPNSGMFVGDYLRSDACNTSSGSLNISPVLNPGSSFASTFNFRVPDDLDAGDYYIYVFANATKTIYEYPGTDQIARSNKFTISKPDLTVSSVNVPATAKSGQPLPVTYEVLNTGNGGVHNQSRTDYLYLSDNANFDGSATLIDSATYPSSTLLTGIAETFQKQITLPEGTSGQKYVYVKVNAGNSFNELSYTNNVNDPGDSLQISLTPPPDLVVTSVSLANQVYSSTGFPIKYRITNNGSGVASGKWKDSIYISCNNSFSYSDAYFAGERTQQLYIPAGDSYSDSFNLVIPQTYMINNIGCMSNDTAEVYFFVRTNANKGLFEPEGSNNTGVSTQTTIINKTVDLVVTSVSGNDSAFVGRNFKVRWSVKNLGLNPNDNTYPGWNDAAWLSADSSLTNSILLGNKKESARLDQNESYSDSAEYRINKIPDGWYYLAIKTNAYDRIPAERNTNNNLNLARNEDGEPLQIYVSDPGSPDLVSEIISAPESGIVGQPLKIVYKVTNIGVVATQSNKWNDGLWLSPGFLQGYPLAGKNQARSLDPGQSYIDSFDLAIPLTLTQGTYIAGIKPNTNSGMLYESDLQNNPSYSYIVIYVPDPVDLTVVNIDVPDTAILGEKINIHYRLQNNSNNPVTGQEIDGIYFSQNPQLSDSSDLLAGTQTNSTNILPVNTQAFEASPRITGLTEGDYYVKVKADIMNNILESDKLNNTGIADNKVYVKVRELITDNPESGKLYRTGDYLYYKLVVPEVLKGSTMMIRLTSSDSLTAFNQMYAGLGYIPSAARFDYTFSKPNYGNQQIIIETVLDSVYYIAARNTQSNTEYQDVVFEAMVLPFSILSVNSNTGGNTGNVTVKLNGTLFSSGMAAKLIATSDGTIINAASVYYVNGTTAYATFNLKGASLGTYDVSLTKPDESVASLPVGFTVQNTNKGGLLTGGSTTGQTGIGSEPGCDPGAEAGMNSQLQTELVIPPRVFAGWPFQIKINYINTTNVDIPVQVLTLYSQSDAPVAFTKEGLDQEETTLTIEFRNEILPGNMIPAGSSGTVIIWCKAPKDVQAHQILYFNLK